MEQTVFVQHTNHGWDDETTERFGGIYQFSSREAAERWIRRRHYLQLICIKIDKLGRSIDYENIEEFLKTVNWNGTVEEFDVLRGMGTCGRSIPDFATENKPALVEFYPKEELKSFYKVVDLTNIIEGRSSWGFKNKYYEVPFLTGQRIEELAQGFLSEEEMENPKRCVKREEDYHSYQIINTNIVE